VYAEIVTIGDELCRGEIVDTNSSWLAARLWDLDITVRWMTSCRDDEDDMRRVLRDAVGRADLVVCSGGLGPTEDDLTVDVVSGLLGADPVIDEPARQRWEARVAGRFPITALGLRQLRVPTGSIVHGNPAGAAPGFEVRLGGVPVVCLPGVPREVHGIYGAALEGHFRAMREARGDAPAIARRIWRVFGRGESQISEACRGVVDGVPGATIHYQVKFPEVLVKIVIKDPDRAAASARLEAVDAQLRQRLGHHIYGDGEVALPTVVGQRLIERRLTVGTAESCTGGLVGELLTGMAGSSAYYRGGVITYADDEKVRQLGVARETLAAHGAVSEATVREMALGVRDRMGTDLGVALSGIAGPGGGTPEKPVGLVWLALAGPGEGGAPSVVTRRIDFPGARDQIRTLAAWWALSMLLRATQTSEVTSV
jgi:nicotinamide-nucleotide amidase